jgi:hypothetical protein
MLEKTRDALTTQKNQRTLPLAQIVQSHASHTEFALIAVFMQDVR